MENLLCPADGFKNPSAGIDDYSTVKIKLLL